MQKWYQKRLTHGKQSAIISLKLRTRKRRQKMYTVKKLYLGKHKMDNGETITDGGFAVVNEKGEIETNVNPIAGNLLISLFDRKYTARLQADHANKKAA